MFPLAACYFFFNGAGLPLGLFFTSIFAPALYVWLYLRGVRWVNLWFVLGLAPFIAAHMIDGIESPYYYLRSALLLWTVYVAAYAICVFLLRVRNLDRLFDELINANLCITLLAIFLLPTPARKLLWQNDTGQLMDAHRYIRLDMLTSEPSVYASLMLPLAVFAILRFMRAPTQRNFRQTAFIMMPFLLCQSLGGVAMIMMGVWGASLMMLRDILRRSKVLLVLVILGIGGTALILIPSPISARVMQVLSGNDSSAHSRTVFSFILAYAVAAPKSLWWGAGLGQTKLIDVSSLGIGFVKAVIPNAIAGMFAELGIIGVMAKLSVEIILFFRMGVRKNSFQLAMFIVAFATQFTGSYLANIQEYVLWFFAFAPIFPQMDVIRRTPSGKLHAR